MFDSNLRIWSIGGRKVDSVLLNLVRVPNIFLEEERCASTRNQLYFHIMKWCPKVADMKLHQLLVQDSRFSSNVLLLQLFINQLLITLILLFMHFSRYSLSYINQVPFLDST